MAVQRVTIKLTELRCIAQSDGGGPSEPYLWTTFFAVDARKQPTETGAVSVHTPSYDQFRTEFPDGIKAGSVAQVPIFVASHGFDFNFDRGLPLKLFGVIALLMEEDSTPERFMVAGLIAYVKEIEAQLQSLLTGRLLSGDEGPLTDAETDAIKAAVGTKVREAVARGQNIGALGRNQDDNLGFVFRLFSHRMDAPEQSEFRPQSFDLPTISKVDSFGRRDRFRLSGVMTVGPVPSPPIVRCPDQRAALQAKQDEIGSIQNQIVVLQKQLQTAPPQAKGDIVRLIEAAKAEAAVAEAALPALQAALDKCLRNLPPKSGGNGGVIITGQAPGSGVRRLPSSD